MLSPSDINFSNDSGTCHHCQVASTMMTNATEVVINCDMNKKRYTKAEMQQLIEEIRSATGWARDRVGVESGLGKQKLKDWSRRGKKIDPVDALYIVELHEKYANNSNKDKIARSELNTAIKLWFEDEEQPAIQRLALAAYKEIYHGENPPEIIGSPPAESLILLSIMELQIAGEQLTNEEIAFSLWLSANNISLSEGNAWIRSSQFINAEYGHQIGKRDKLFFFKAYTRKNINNGG